MPDVAFSIDYTRSMFDQDIPGHNRWHPDIPIASEVSPGDEFRIECLDWTDGQVKNDDSANDIRDMDLLRCHVLSGPVGIRGAEPGDLLVIDILDLGPVPQSVGDLPGQGWGYTGIFSKVNGGGFLTDYYPDAYKTIWDFRGQQASSRHIPGVSYTGITHPGLFGTAPSAELLAKWNERERALIARDPDRVPPLALPPDETNALAGALDRGSAEFAKVAREGARTIPARENGGNHDIKNLTRGSRIYYPVHVPGAKFSGGDLHFSQGDGEITFCGAIEMGGFIDFGVDLIKGGMEKYGVTTNPVFMPGNVEPRYSEFVCFTGVSVEHSTNTNEYMDATLAYKNACLNAIEYLKKFGYTGEQAYMIIGTAPIEGRVSAVVDLPNACCSLYLPTEIFDVDIRPSADGPVTQDRGQVAITS
ncbi:formamidase [Phytoactinopolyspora mesophila]|uniref:Acetamidase/formamidase family protein n=1 Tax=Phytoactinopolyspora mesophila TaxID=2650750 RepID=A0A7K3M9Q1_9ACTN|nr:formamidase [Phytoactinopolyspora mesophila]NDL59692.1 acetamidase/formamidase family protein [Phytoactinopolyspora mesophila]